ncbi:MAG TPA: hypothetical protein VF547_01410 [Allosphingosinicella sp.]|jgi:hypothetical protein
MADSIAWSFSAVASTGGSAKAAGKTEVDGVMIVRTTIPVDPAPATLTLQLDSAEKVSFLSISSSAYRDNLMIKSGEVELDLEGPLVLHGNAVALFSDNLTSLQVTNPAGDAVELTILVGFDPTG